MEFMNRGSHPSQTPNGAVTGDAPANHASGGSKKKVPGSKALKIISVVLLFSIVILAVSLIASFAFNSTPSQSKYLNKDKYQAVFLNNGQVYFGKIGKLNDRFVTLSDIYYLRVNQQVQPGETESQQDVSLAKLGNELHGPEDVMVINAKEVQFWENLKDDGQVVKAITEYKKNPSAGNATTPANTTEENTNAEQ